MRPDRIISELDRCSLLDAKLLLTLLALVPPSGMQFLAKCSFEVPTARLKRFATCCRKKMMSLADWYLAATAVFQVIMCIVLVPIAVSSSEFLGIQICRMGLKPRHVAMRPFLVVSSNRLCKKCCYSYGCGLGCAC